MPGLLDLLGYGGSDQGGLLGQFGRGLRDNSDSLMGFGMGMMSGGTPGEGFANGLQGMQSGQQMALKKRLVAQQEAEKAQKIEAAKQYAAKYPQYAPLLSANPELADKFAAAEFNKQLNPDDPLDKEYKRAQIEKLKEGKQPSFEEKQFNALTPEEQAAARRGQFGLGDKEAKMQTVEAPDGTKQSVWVKGGQAFNLDGTPYTGAPAGGGNPYASGHMNADQANSATYADRVAEAHKVISETEGVNKGFKGGLAGTVLTADAPAFMKSEDRQKSDQAQRDFVNAILRKESGAAISPAEFDNARKQYFPQPGDTDEVIAQKRMNRETAISGMMRAAGPRYQPPKDWASGKPPGASGAKAGKTGSGVSWGVE